MPNEEQSPTVQQLLSLTPVWLDRAIGSAASIAGLGMAAVFINFALAVASRQSGPSFPALVILGAVATIAGLLLTAGYRLVLQRPGRNRSLFGHRVWFSLCGSFLALAAFIAYAAFAVGLSASVGEALSSCLLLALFSFGAGSHFRHKRSRQK